ncbi:MAG: transposase [Chlorobiaceae bacterium]|nr:transposase [Chlorobiaceae bacterium]
MPNHFHLLIYFDREVDFSNIMRSLTCSYVKSYNKWYGRTGHLFQGDFQYKEIEREGYLTHLCRYIHLNPVKAQLVRLPEEWEFSDYREWTSGEPPTSVKVLDHVEVGGLSKLSLRQILIGSAEDYKIFVMDFAEEQKMDLKINKMLFG